MVRSRKNNSYLTSPVSKSPRFEKYQTAMIVGTQTTKALSHLDKVLFKNIKRVIVDYDRFTAPK